ncbi:hypothetical protein SUGI_0238130 [Cryptomeria japonica]|uniref:uncharacterized protein LOC131058929 n=1 Tax=Cryptomeria japonica TaxID=3369 RepID=UPI002408A9C5|nr:uncharacterized protein LOC131058929 [Cryptomeria japonica]GLJ14694.1 hypothetical protein SUGI_0238130 [Cryptomeria japonica]
MATVQPYFQQPPPTNIYQQQAVSHGSHPSGSVGMVIVVLAVITILGVLAGMVGRLCAGRRIGDSEYDFEGWVEKKCSTCIDGHIDGSGGGGHVHVPIAMPAENGEPKPTEANPTPAAS